MATIKAVVRARRANKNNLCKVEFAVCHQRCTAYIDSGLYVSVCDVNGKKVANFANGVCSQKESDYVSKNNMIMQMLDRYTKKLSSIKNIALKTSEQIKTILCASGDSQYTSYKVVTICSAGAELIQELTEDNRHAYARNINNGIDRFKEWAKGDLPLEDLSSSMLNEYQRWLRRQPSLCYKGENLGLMPKVDKEGKKILLSEDSVTKYLQAIKTIVNRNINNGRVKYDIHPFAGVRLKKGRVKICDITIEQFLTISRSKTKSRNEEVAKDCFMLSFYMGGMNLADICKAKWNGDAITYTRKKVEGRLSQRQTLPIIDKVKPIISKYIQEDGSLYFGYAASNMNNRCANGLKRIAEREKIIVIDGNVSMMSARKTWAQFAGLIGVQRYVVDYCMGHSAGNEIADHYQRAMAMQAEAACKAVADFVDHPEKWQPILEYRAMLSAGINWK